MKEAWQPIELGYAESGRYAMAFPNLGVFRFSSTAGDPVRGEVLPHIDHEVVEDAYRRMVVPMVLQVRGLEALHSSAVLTDGFVLALCGTSHSGKSTLAYALTRRDHPLWADDSVAFEHHGNQVMAVSLPSRIRLRPESSDFFHGAGSSGDVEGLREVRHGAQAAPLGTIFV